MLSFVYNHTAASVVRQVKIKESKSLPQYELAKKHIENTKFITTREELLKILPKNGVVAEIGVDQGGFSQKILNINKPKKLHLIDYWGTKRYHKQKQQQVKNKFSQEIKSKTVVINTGKSIDIYNQFKDCYFDWIYIDTTHSYRATIKELKLYENKVKPGGIIAGHDYILGNWNALVRYGVIEAVYEFCVKHDWEIIYLTAELRENPSFALRKIARH